MPRSGVAIGTQGYLSQVGALIRPQRSGLATSDKLVQERRIPYIDNVLSIRQYITMDAEIDASTLLPLIVADIFELAGRFRSEGEAVAATVGQTQARWQVMSAAAGTPLTVPQIARRLGVTRQAVQRIADVLTREDWATFEPNPDHRGSPHLALTARGRAALAQLSSAALTSHVDLSRRLAGLDVDAIHRGLRRLIEAINDRNAASARPGAQP